MKAAVVTAAGQAPVYAEFATPIATEGEELISVQASALSPFSKSRASGSHYSSDGGLPAVAGTDGVGVTQDGRRVYFVLPRAPFGALAEFCPVSSDQCVRLPDDLDQVTAAAIANPGMSAWAALVERAHLASGRNGSSQRCDGNGGQTCCSTGEAPGRGQGDRYRPQRGRTGRAKAARSRYRDSVHSGRATPIGSKELRECSQAGVRHRDRRRYRLSVG